MIGSRQKRRNKNCPPLCALLRGERGVEAGRIIRCHRGTVFL